ncbi:hypothetical protein CLHUN_31040 [Ruminiclostridium hungatei]|uniref:Uncharacterized protein n=1 Tax=Ruminiclostridium hungatei TaxID=48256 RepID=A0A1V4SGH3_RUMHU|nr:hypothetical protein [Ruminiclostridium hungatei]OPX42960.1 hypothetical protein CLHUN_31040 [Ruminiclostridium hungatei]
MTKNVKDILISVFCVLIAGAAALFILSWDEHALKIANLGVFFFKLVPFVFAIMAICFFPFEKISTPVKLLFCVSAFGVFFCYGVAKLIYYFIEQVTYEEFYLLLQLLTPFIILALAFALRCGGMKSKDVGIFGAISIIFMISGIEDLTSQYVRIAIVPGYQIPENWDWANHMTVFLGRVLTKNEAYIFIAVHFVIIALILYLAYSKNNPLKRLLKSKGVLENNEFNK